MSFAIAAAPTLLRARLKSMERFDERVLRREEVIMSSPALAEL
jgi:hypothetical protein